MSGLPTFSTDQLRHVERAVSVSEELVSNAYKMSTSQWLRRKYDVRTLAKLEPHEVVHGPFAQIVRYEGQRKDSMLGSMAYDFYNICLQDHTILAALAQRSDIRLFPFVLYILVHELIHIVRFSTFQQHFEASPEERILEEQRVHARTREILSKLQTHGLKEALDHFDRWCTPFENLSDR
ncbi:MAG: hypothetical protein LJE65_04170 [Desulfobacteraceae bacterium]|nr:hypothetical protein [Desulfobacteraceae bacterium]